jgi:hypothetical protein
VVTVHGRDFAFDAPEQIPAGLTTFRFLNAGPGLHHLVIVRLDSGKTLADWQRLPPGLASFPAWAIPAGGPNAAEPNGESNATVNLSPGNYLLVCLVDVPDGIPHFAKGMMRPLTVAAASGAAATPPTPDVTVTLSDYKFDVSGPLTAGHHVFLVRTSPGQQHELLLLRLEPGKAFTDVLAWMGKMQGPPPAHPVGGIGPAMNGTTSYFTADLAPGTYVFACFLPDARDGKAHFEHGMIQTFVVT